MRKGDKHMVRFITEEDRQKIKEAKLREKEINQYQFEAVQRMKSKDTGYRMREYKDKY